MKRPMFFALLLLAFTSLMMTTCDMTDISPAGSRSSKKERDELERTGHFLKLTNMSVNTQIANVASVSVANSASSIAKLNQNNPIRIFKDKDTSTAYLPLVYNNDSEFTETGSFFVAFTVHVDALTVYTIDLADKVAVPFTDGRGELDIRKLPVSGPGNTPDLSEKEREELERSGHFLKLTHMPLHTQSTNVALVQIANSASSIATLNRAQGVRIFRETSTCTVYIPLMYFDNTEFTETGSFFVAFTVHVDAITSYVITITDKILVPFINGRGELDIRMLPYGGIVAADRRYLTIYNLPLYLLSQNVSNVLIHNRSGPVAKCEDYSLVEVSTFGGKSTVSIPLSFVNSTNTAFSGTGNFYVAFELFTDALTHYTVTAEDRVLVYFIDGNGYLDINDLPPAISADHRYLTITDLPANLLPQNITNVKIYNQNAAIAKCEDYSLLEISVSDDKASVNIPLSFNNPPSIFTGTGNFIVTFDINIDANTSYVITTDDNVQVYFLNGNGSLDINNIPDKLVSYLTIKSLPINMTKQHITNVNVYNLVETVASGIYNKIILLNEGGFITAKIPLASSKGGYFQDTGRFAISFTANVDIETCVLIDRDHDVVLDFIGGSATFDVVSTYGYFSAELYNLSDTTKPIIKTGAEFDVNGYRHKITENLRIPANPPDDFSGVLYLYAFRSGTDVYYELSASTPTLNASKKGYYFGYKRALWKMIYIKEENLFLFKTYVSDNFPHLGTLAVNDATYSALIDKKSTYRPDLLGASNPAVDTFILQPGVYVVKLNGAGGGGGYGSISESAVSGSSSGGDGGTINEIITLNTATSFTAFTGSGGFAATMPNVSGNFTAYGLKQVGYYLVTTLMGDKIYGSSVSNASPSNPNYTLDDYTINFNFSAAASGGGGGGGGSGTFLYSAQGYFLCAGGGGGGSGGSFFTPGGAGGSGGAIGPGAGGGAAGYLQQFNNDEIYMTATEGNGGNGGGLNAGSGGRCIGPISNFNGSNSISILSSNNSISGGIGASSYSSSSFDIPLTRIGEFCLNDIRSLPNTSYEGEFDDDVSYKAISLIPDATTYSFSSSSGNGGSSPTVLYLSGPQSWLNTNSAIGAGASSPTLPPISFTGKLSVTPIMIFHQTSQQSFISHGYGISFNDYTSTITTTSKRAGVNGSSGGNNRNTTRGGGAPGGKVNNNKPTNGSPGSIIIYRIY